MCGVWSRWTLILRVFQSLILRVFQSYENRSIWKFFSLRINIGVKFSQEARKVNIHTHEGIDL